jgi:hypothetical protein
MPDIYSLLLVQRLLKSKRKAAIPVMDTEHNTRRLIARIKSMDLSANTAEIYFGENYLRHGHPLAVTEFIFVT